MRRLLHAALMACLAGPVLAGETWRPALDAQLAEVHRAVEPYRDFSHAKRQGWRLFGGDAPAMGEHWNHKDYPAQDARQPLDLSRPMNLMYTAIDGRRELVGVTYGVRLGPGEPLPEGFAGPLDHWHVHDFATILEAATEERPILRWLGGRWLDSAFAPDGRTRLAMVHVWLDGTNPDGVFVNNHRPLAYRRLGLGPDDWRHGTLGAAKGLAMAHPDGCEAEVGGKLWVAAVDRQRKRRLMRLCEALGEETRAMLGAPPDALNATAERNWRRLEVAMDDVLTNEERRRIATIVEHGDHAMRAEHGAGHSH